MATLRPDSVFAEYAFTENELTTAQLLNPLQKMYFQTKYAQYLKEKATSLLPESGDLDRSFFLAMGNIEGKLQVLQELFQECKEAEVRLTTPNQDATAVSASSVEILQTAERAAQQVHNLDNN